MASPRNQHAPSPRNSSVLFPSKWVAIPDAEQRADPNADAACGKSGLYLGKRDVAVLLQHCHDLLVVGFGLR